MGCANPTSTPLLGGCCPSEATNWRFVSALRWRYGYGGFHISHLLIPERMRLWRTWDSVGTAFVEGIGTIILQTSGSVDPNSGEETATTVKSDEDLHQEILDAGAIPGRVSERIAITQTRLTYTVRVEQVSTGALLATWSTELNLRTEFDSTIDWIDALAAEVNSQNIDSVLPNHERRLNADGTITETPSTANGMLLTFTLFDGRFPNPNSESVTVTEDGFFRFPSLPEFPVRSYVDVTARYARAFERASYLRERQRQSKVVFGQPPEFDTVVGCDTFEPETVVYSPAIRFPLANRSSSQYTRFASASPDPCSLP